MSRGLTAGQVTRLTNARDRVEDIVEIYLYDGNYFFYYTTGDLSLSLSTPTSGGTQTFTPDSFVSSISSVSETYEIGSNPMSLTFQRLKSGSGADLLPARLRTVNLSNSRVVLYKLFRDVDTWTPDTTDGLINYYDGSISGLSVEYDLDTYRFNISCQGAFTDYRVKGRRTSDIYGALTATKLYWGSLTL